MYHGVHSSVTGNAVQTMVFRLKKYTPVITLIRGKCGGHHPGKRI
jgi:hypothetical protein